MIISKLSQKDLFLLLTLSKKGYRRSLEFTVINDKGIVEIMTIVRRQDLKKHTTANKYKSNSGGFLLYLLRNPKILTDFSVTTFIQTIGNIN